MHDLHGARPVDEEALGATAAGRSWSWRLTYAIGPDILFLCAFGLLVIVLSLIYRARFHVPIFMSTGLPAGVLVGLIVLAFAARARAILTGDAAMRREFFRLSLATVRDWFPLVLIASVYESFHDLTDLIRPEVVDGTLRRLDEILFTVEPTLALQAITRPWLTEYFTFAYALYFVYPVVVLAVLYRRGEFIRFRELGLALSLCFYLGLLGYMLVPAIGPRYAMAQEFTVPLDGIWLTGRAAAAWNHIESIQRDCFPSQHTSITAVSLIYLWRYRRAWRWGRALLALWVPLIVSLWISTIYLRYHYLVDVVAGWALALLAARAAPAFTRWYYARKLGAAPAVSTDPMPAV